MSKLAEQLSLISIPALMLYVQVCMSWGSHTSTWYSHDAGMTGVAELQKAADSQDMLTCACYRFEEGKPVDEVALARHINQGSKDPKVRQR